jgi:hypothetical protein
MFYGTVAKFTLDARNVDCGTTGVPLEAVNTPSLRFASDTSVLIGIYIVSNFIFCLSEFKLSFDDICPLNARSSH